MKKLNSRREILKKMAAYGGFWSTRSLATGLPIGILMGGVPSQKALAEDLVDPQFLLMSLNHTGDPINNNCPGVYDTGLDGVYTNTKTSMTPQNVSLSSGNYKAAKPWADLQRNVPWAMDRMSFIHHDTRTNIHAQYAGVMKLMGSSRGPNGEANTPEYLPSIISSALQPLHDAIQAPPLFLDGQGVDYAGQALGKIRPNTLKTLFPALNNKEKMIREIRDADLLSLNAELKNRGTRKQRAWLDDHVQSLSEVRQLNETLVDRFSAINSNSPEASIDAAIIAFKLNITSVAAFKISFGGDNHDDPGLGIEARETVSGCKTMETMFNRLKEEGMEDKVTFANCGVFGRTLGIRKNGNGRDHNLHHHVTLLAGKNVKSGVIGGLKSIGGDFGAMPINSVTGRGENNGDIPLDESLESVAKTIGAACGVSQEAMATRIQRAGSEGDQNVGKVITAAIKS